MFTSELATLRKLGIRHLLQQSLNFATVICTALMMWKGLSIVFNTESPIVVVLSGSMEPAFYRGDLLFLSLPRQRPIQVGDITVYNVPGAAIPIVHRVIEVHDEKPRKQKTKNRNVEEVEEVKGEQWLLTKGDNNKENDVGLYNGIKYLKRSHIVGKVDAYVPYVGYITIMMNDFPQIKYAGMAILGFMVLINRE